MTSSSDAGRSPFISPVETAYGANIADGGIEADKPTLEEQEALFEQVKQLLENPVPANDFWIDRRVRGVGIGELRDGTRVRQLARGKVSTRRGERIKPCATP